MCVWYTLIWRAHFASLCSLNIKRFISFVSARANVTITAEMVLKPSSDSRYSRDGLCAMPSSNAIQSHHCTGYFFNILLAVSFESQFFFLRLAPSDCCANNFFFFFPLFLFGLRHRLNLIFFQIQVILSILYINFSCFKGNCKSRNQEEETKKKKERKRERENPLLFFSFLGHIQNGYWLMHSTNIR